MTSYEKIDSFIDNVIINLFRWVVIIGVIGIFCIIILGPFYYLAGFPKPTNDGLSIFMAKFAWILSIGLVGVFAISYTLKGLVRVLAWLVPAKNSLPPYTPTISINTSKTVKSFKYNPFEND